ncbi:hypothetical protein D3C85_1175530 [compost metagenome]
MGIGIGLFAYNGSEMCKFLCTSSSRICWITVILFSMALTPSYLVPPCAERPFTSIRNHIDPCCLGKIRKFVGSGIKAASALYPFTIAANVPAPPLSSSMTLSKMTSPFNWNPRLFTASIAKSRETLPPFISVAPRPYNFPSTTLPL